MKKVLLTGGSRGIGLAIKTLLEKNGYQVLAPARQELNLLDKNSISNFIKRNKNLKIYALINNAGINKPTWIEDATAENILSTIQTNLIAPIMLTSGFVGALSGNKVSHIVNISSMFGIIARGKQSIYSASKFGLNGATKAIALELAPKNILVNSVCPGFTNTDLTLKNSAKKNAALAKDVPLGRFAQPSEIAELVKFLISEKNTYITGQSIIIDGGYVCR